MVTFLWHILSLTIILIGCTIVINHLFEFIMADRTTTTDFVILQKVIFVWLMTKCMLHLCSYVRSLCTVTIHARYMKIQVYLLLPIPNPFQLPNLEPNLTTVVSNWACGHNATYRIIEHRKWIGNMQIRWKKDIEHNNGFWFTELLHLPLTPFNLQLWTLCTMFLEVPSTSWCRRREME